MIKSEGHLSYLINNGMLFERVKSQGTYKRIILAKDLDEDNSNSISKVEAEKIVKAYKAKLKVDEE